MTTQRPLNVVTGGVQAHLPPEAATAVLRAADARAWRGVLPTLLVCDSGSLEVLLNWLVDHGYHVLHTDADAVWIEDPMHDIDALDDCDLVVSQDAVGPSDALATMGVVVSCGFFVARAGAATCGLSGDVMAQLRQGAADDRVALNRALVARGMLCDLSDPWGAMTVHDRRVPIFDRTVRGSDHSGPGRHCSPRPVTSVCGWIARGRRSPPGVHRRRCHACAARRVEVPPPTTRLARRRARAHRPATTGHDAR